MQSISALYQAGHYGDAVSLYLSSNFRPQIDPGKIFVAGAAYFKLGEYRESYRCLQSIQVSYSEDINFLSLYAASCRHLGKLDESKKVLFCAPLEPSKWYSPVTKLKSSSVASVAPDAEISF